MTKTILVGFLRHGVDERSHFTRKV